MPAETQTRRRLSAPGHRLTVKWSGEYGAESSSTGFCPCGWTESASNQDEVRFEYRMHLSAVTGFVWNPAAGLYTRETTPPPGGPR